MKARFLFLIMVSFVLFWSCEPNEPDSVLINNAPVVPSQTFTVPENFPDGQLIGRIQATDKDGDALEFSLLQDASGLFEVTQNGNLFLALNKKLSYEGQGEHTLTVYVHDGTVGRSGSVAIKVTPEVSEDEPPAENEPPTADNQEFEVNEDIADDQVIGTVTATDPEEDALTFTITENDDDLFAISEGGELTLAEGMQLDFENKPEHSLTIEVSDGTNDPVTFAVTVNVTNVIESLAEDPEALVLKFTVTAGQELTIGTNPDYDYDFTIDWGDGTVQENVTAQNPSNTYTAGDTYTVAIKGNFPALRMIGADDASRNSLVDVAQWGAQQWQSMESAFRFCDNLVEFSASDAPDLTETEDMSFMFMNCDNFNGAIGHWDTNNVIDMNSMFQNAASFNQPLVQQPEGWNTSNVANMGSMFAGATAFDQSLGNWDISSVTNMGSMLDNCGMSLASANATIIGWSDFVDTNGGPTGITLGMQGLTVCGPEVDIAVALLGNTYSWQFPGIIDLLNCP